MSRSGTPQQAPFAVRHSPRTKIPHASPTFSTINVDHMFASPPLVPLHHSNAAGTGTGSSSSSNLAPPSVPPAHAATPQQSTMPSTTTSSSSHLGGGEFAHPASVVQSPMHAPVNAMGFMRSLNRGGGVAGAGAAAGSLSAAATPATRSRRGSLGTSMLLAEPAESKAAGTPATSSLSAAALLRSSSTSPTVRHRSMRSPHPGGPGTAAGTGIGFPSPSLDPFDTPSLSGLGSLSASKSRYTHGLSKPFDGVAQSPFMMPTRRSPRVGAHSPASSFQSHFMSPSPGMPSLSHAHSPNISFALPSPSLAAAAGGLGMPTASSSTRDLNGGLHAGSSHHLNSHIFGSWDGDALTRRSPRLQAASQQSHAARRSPTSFNMFSPPTHAQYSAHAHSAMGDMHMSAAAPSGSATRQSSTSIHTRGHSGGGHRRPSMSPPLNPLRSLNSVPSSPNLSILGKLRSLHASGPGGEEGGEGDGDARPHTPHLKLEGGEYAAQQQRQIEHIAREQEDQTQQRSGSKRGRAEYESYESPSPKHQQSQLQSQSLGGGAGGAGANGGGGGSNGYAGMPITSPAMVGALPPSSQPMSMADAARSPEPFTQAQQPTPPPPQTLPPKSHELEQQQFTPSRRVPKSSLLKREKMDAEGMHSVSRPRVPRPPLSSESEGLSSPDMSGASTSAEPTSLGNGSGSSCHQCKSRRLIVDLVYCCNLYKKGRDKKVAPTATSSSAHSCRKKYCGTCLQKFYNERPPPKKHAGVNSTWPCPACRGICCCAACRRIKAKQLGEIDPASLSPASVLAYSFVYCPDVLLESMGNHQDYIELQAEQQQQLQQAQAAHLQQQAQHGAAAVAAASHHAAAAAAAASVHAAHQHQQSQLSAMHAAAHASGKYGGGKRRHQSYDQHHHQQQQQSQHAQQQQQAQQQHDSESEDEYEDQSSEEDQ